MEINAETLTIILGVVLTLLASYIPGVAVWYDKLGEKSDGSNDNGTLKRLVMLGVLLLITGSIYGLSCTSWGPLLGIAVSCDQPGAAKLILAFIYAIMANQSVYKISPEAPWVKEAREMRLGQASMQLGQG
jgi:hypothetical protein